MKKTKIFLCVILFWTSIVLGRDPCLTEGGRHCVFPFTYLGTTYSSCTMEDAEVPWCPTEVDTDSKEFREGEHDWGTCSEDCSKLNRNQTTRSTATTTTATTTPLPTTTACDGRCSKTNQKCDTVTGQCQCLEGYEDTDNPDGDQDNCRCVIDWTRNDRRYSRSVCSSCPWAFKLKTWSPPSGGGNQKKWCQFEQSQCPPTKEELDERYPNIQKITFGYNILLGNLLELPDEDPRGHSGYNGQHQPIFAAYSIRASDARVDARCGVSGYLMDGSRKCSGDTQTTVFSQGEEVRRNVGNKLKTGDFVEKISFTVSETDNAQFSNSISFGESLSSSQNDDTNHCVDKGFADSLELGTTKESQVSREEADTFEENETKSTNRNRESSVTDSSSSQTEKSSSWEEGSTTDVNVGVSAGGGFSAFGCSASLEVSTNVGFGTSSTRGGSTSNLNSKENSKTNSISEGSEKSYGYSRSNTVSGSDSQSRGESQSKSKNSYINTNICKSGSRAASQDNDQRIEGSTGGDRGVSKSYEIPGDMRSVKHSMAMVESETFFAETSGSITHTEVTCQTYNARIDRDHPPAFSDAFKSQVVRMSRETNRMWSTDISTSRSENGTLESFLNPQNQEEYDKLFSDFIYDFGTHYIESASMGAIMRVKNKLEKLKSSLVRDSQVEKCLVEQMNKVTNNNSTNFQDSDNCGDENTKKTVEDILETSSSKIVTYGSGSNNNIHLWTGSEFLQPTMLPDYKLQPIVKLFTDKMMTTERISNEDGTQIDYQRILSWFIPRYVTLIGRCKLLTNHRVSEGSKCVPNKPYMVSARDGLSQTDLGSFCQSLPDHILPTNGVRCLWCKEGVRKHRLSCKL